MPLLTQPVVAIHLQEHSLPCLASGDGEMSTKELREALVHATVSASFTLEDFGIKGIESISLDAYHDRLSRYCAITGTSIDSP